MGEVCIGKPVVLSGIRPAGRTVDMEKGRNCHGLLYLQRGEARFWENGKLTAVVGEGELLYIPKGWQYKMQYTQKDSTYVLLNFDLYDGTGEELAYRLLGTVCSENMTLLAGHLGDSRILPGVLLLKQSYLENIPVERFARACSISISLFRELFKRQYGVSPVQYRNQLRIGRAQQLLRDGGCTVAEAAYASGFENIGYFCNYYKKVTGCRPGQTARDGEMS